MSQSNKKMLAAGAVMVGLSSFVPNPFITGAMAQMTASDTLNMSATVVNPLSVSQVQSLNWGVFALNAGGTYDLQAGGTVTLAAADGFIVTNPTVGSVKIVVPSGAAFSLTIPKFKTGTQIKMALGTLATTAATANQLLKVSRIYVKGTTKVKMSAGAAQLDDSLRASPNHDLGNLKLSGTGTGRFTFGGRMIFTNTQALGAYTGTFSFLTTL